MNRELDKPDHEAASLEGIAEYHLAVGEADDGTEYLRHSLEIFERLGMTADIARVKVRMAVIAPR